MSIKSTQIDEMISKVESGTISSRTYHSFAEYAKGVAS